MKTIFGKEENIYRKVKKNNILNKVFLSIKEGEFFRDLNNKIEELSNSSLNLKIEAVVFEFIESIY